MYPQRPSGSSPRHQNNYSHLAVPTYIPPQHELLNQQATLPVNGYYGHQPVISNYVPDSGIRRLKPSDYSCGPTQYVDYATTSVSPSTYNGFYEGYSTHAVPLLPHGVQSVQLDAYNQPSSMTTQFHSHSSQPIPTRSRRTQQVPAHDGHVHVPSQAGRRKSETSTTQARRRSSASQPYPKFRRDLIDKEAPPTNSSSTARQYQSTAVLINQFGPVGPTNHVLVPQDCLFGEPTSYNRNTDHLFKPIEFRPKGFHELGVRLTQVLKQHSEPIEDPDARVLEKVTYREIKVKIQWPGYPHYPFERRVKTHNGAITRTTLLVLLCDTMVKFVLSLRERGAEVEKGYEMWRIGKGGLKANEFFVTGLLHRGGCHFQPEIWVPQPRV